MSFVQITRQPLQPEAIISKVKTSDSGCVAAYIGLIRDNSLGKPVLSVEYTDVDSMAEKRLQTIADEIKQKFPVNNVALVHRVAKLKVGDINLVVAIAAAHRTEGFAACQYAVDRFKEIKPAKKKETYQDGSVWSGD